MSGKERATATSDLSAYRAATASYRRIIVAHLAETLASSNDEEHRKGLRLAMALDEAGLNVDLDVDAYADQFCEIDPRKLWQLPSTRYPELTDEPPF